jgi:quercetin dioxygenase-like cupin family protein
MTDRANYTQGQIALDDARFMMHADRLTYAVVQTRLREAALEEAEDQVAHLEERWDALAPLDTANARRVAALAAEVDQLRALAVAGELDQVLVVLRAGGRMAEHRAAGRISVQALAGHVRLHTAGTNVDLPVGRLVSLERDVPHDVEAVEESAFLLTIAWQGEHAVTAADTAAEQEGEG